ncbi:hypothetical protein [Mangrovihabitans endophyticus]|uniref:Uncharacterized protein n=1 Tax=Mangrovihabitans endophyticus TaxID=1751298 RepID=A0A8J3FRV0_9ACTN|nr:hypothetical protein [Mangrovihabitans endophyticus]GGL14667.1 hypothetical protein GCM10012284_56750 [Mangrovihabitans endophyticus]
MRRRLAAAVPLTVRPARRAPVPLLPVPLLSGALLMAGVLVAGAAGCSGASSDAGAAPSPAAGVSGGPAPTPGATVSAGADGSTGADSSGGDAAAGGDAALSADTEAICDQAARTGQNFASVFAQDLQLLIESSSAQDEDQVAKAREKTARDVDSYAYALTDMSKLADDPTVKKALARMGKQVTALKGDVRELDDSKLAALSATLDKACGKG